MHIYAKLGQENLLRMLEKCYSKCYLLTKLIFKHEFKLIVAINIRLCQFLFLVFIRIIR